MATTSILWFRRDLRLSDHPALAAASDAADEVVGLFVLDTALTGHAGTRRLAFLFESLRDLREQLDGRLLVIRGRPHSSVPRVADAVGAQSVHVSQDFSPYGRRRDERVADALGDIPLVGTGSPYGVSPGQITKSDGSPYKVFTPYFRAWRERGWHSPAHTSAEMTDWVDPGAVPNVHPIEIPAAPEEPVIEPGERAGLRRWREFLDDAVSEYDTQRDRPDLDATSRMSVHLKFGTVHPRTMLADLAARRSDGAASYMRELAFRDFYADVLYNWPHSAWHNWNTGFDGISTDTDDAAWRRFDRWTSGTTGFPIVDAGMRQLTGEGFVHNRVRMIVASFLVKDLHLPWQWGARHFLDLLVDGDIASNQHGWQWTAGCGTDAAPYFRVFNPTSQGKKFDPSGEYVRRWVPELRPIAGAAVHDPGDERPADYPEPMVDHQVERREALDRYSRIS
ncbi:deoxyribodipyrimidine photo-lyase [Gordonia jinhuaensis]|uniref:Deoxyribodipyrimidine photo-lyase n=1 Tax=Gordonia jinhuaensis TaxID=1517702 RepID=A0A916TC77_9ACTN|nr:deoxyribodipyrimidine photo-lyase [Gordonia jinhuaensis]GGB38012.1 deoxyribodipyrimidine photo-lyase [Gordonia jinhuaensis]